MNSQPKYPIGTVTNFGRVVAYLYRFSSNVWFYTLHHGSDEVYKLEHELEFLEASLDEFLKPAFSLGDPVAEAFVCGILQNEDCTYSYYLSSGRDTPYIHWVHEQKAYARLQILAERRRV